MLQTALSLMLTAMRLLGYMRVVVVRRSRCTREENLRSTDRRFEISAGSYYFMVGFLRGKITRLPLMITLRSVGISRAIGAALGRRLHRRGSRHGVAPASMG